MREVSTERLVKDVRRVLENPFWIPSLKPKIGYSRVQDDHDGTFKGIVAVIIDEQGDAWLQCTKPDMGTMLRFRTFGGGGMSLRTRNALMILAEAIRLDNESTPQIQHPNE